MAIDISSIAPNLLDVQARIRSAETMAGRLPGVTQLLAVSKGQTFSAIEAAVAAGQRAFGENYLQEALPKIAALTHHDLEWHFIGRIQSNKIKLIAKHFSWVQSLCSLAHAQQLNQARSSMPPINVCIQVNTSHEASKGGLLREALYPLCQQIQSLPHLRLRGLMTIPQAICSESSQTQQRVPFQALRAAFDELNQAGYSLDTLSMGMSDDYELAIAEGATLVRIGTLLFGPRT